MSSILSLTRATLVNIGEWPAGCQSDIAVAMSPVEDTTGWAITAEFSRTQSGAVDATLTLTTAGGGVTVGNTATKEVILLKMATISTLTAALTGTYFIHVHRTDTGLHDRLALASVNFKKPAV